MASTEAASADWYQVSAEEAATRLGTEPASGLTDSEARKRLERYGPNVVAERGGRSALQALLAQFTGVLTLVLGAAAVLSAFLGDWLDAGAILAIVVLNATLGFFQEYRAERSMAALKRMAAPVVRVRRNGRVQEFSARGLVPGDVVLLETGNVVPADARLLQGMTLRVREAALTGAIHDLLTAFAAGASVLLVVEAWKCSLRRSSTDQGSGPRTRASSC